MIKPPVSRADDPAHRPRAADILRLTFRRFFWLSYDNIGLLILANLAWILLSLPVVTAPAATAGLFHLMARLAKDEPASLRDLLTGFRSLFGPALGIGLIDATVAVILWVNVDFYSHLGGRAHLPGMLFAGLILWAGAFWVLLHAHLLPLLIRGERSLRMLYRKSAILTLDNPAYTIGITAQTTMVLLICVLTGIGLLALSGALTATLLTCGNRALSAKYEPELTAAPPERRGWRDLWRPWDAGSTGQKRER